MNFSDVSITNTIVHRIGNKAKGEDVRVSDRTVEQDENLDKAMKRFFLNSFREEQQGHRFFHEMGLDMNEVYRCAQNLFDEQDFVKNSQQIAQHLFKQTRNAAIKAGDLFVAYFEGIELDDEVYHGIGIFKSESKNLFLGVDGWDIGVYEGIGLNKQDKGCLIIDTEEEEGYKCFLYEAGGVETEYWRNDFLSLSPIEDSYANTYEFMSKCKTFLTTDIKADVEVDRATQINLVKDTVEYFQLNDTFRMEDFKEKVLVEDETIESFDRYISDNKIEQNEFEIAPNAVKKQKRKFKSVLKLDTNFHIYIHGNRDLIEYGIDEETGKKFYKVYFEEEL
ncbi:MAG: hypothetical protein ACI8ZO_000086 [Flavobacteriales bacterium]|jgi:hypothetical protein